MKNSQESVTSIAYGLICICGAIATGFAWFANHNAQVLYGPGLNDLGKFKYFSISLALLGVALLMKWRPALLAFVAIFAFAGAVLIAGSLVSITSSPWVLLNLPVGAIFLVPLFLSIKQWRITRASLPYGP
jgi:hypothetical protein